MVKGTHARAQMSSLALSQFQERIVKVCAALYGSPCMGKTLIGYQEFETVLVGQAVRTTNKPNFKIFCNYIPKSYCQAP